MRILVENILVSIVSIQTDQSRHVNLMKKDDDASRGFNRINPNRSIPTGSKQDLIRRLRTSFNRINPNRSIPTGSKQDLIRRLRTSFNRINPNRSIPTQQNGTWIASGGGVSIVSIQTDQSRHIRRYAHRFYWQVFQSYQSKQINPDIEKTRELCAEEDDVSIVSIQTNQSRHAESNQEIDEVTAVSIVSIQTDQSRRYVVHHHWYDFSDVSIVSIQTDQSRQRDLSKSILTNVRFNRINPNRSIPTSIWTCSYSELF